MLRTLVLVALAGCGGSHDPGFDAGTPADSGAAADSEPNVDDARIPVVDAGPDAETVADLDGDGVPAELDCDDDNPDVGTTASRTCTRECGSGLERCADGAWAPCDALATDCTCPTPGEARLVSCGMCGMASQTCGVDGRWSTPEPCLYEGECTAGASETVTARCGERVRLCSASCAWLPWDERIPPGECESGETELTSSGCAPGETRHRVCSDTCEWDLIDECAIRCAAPPRSSRTGADPVCIPAGTFLWGDSSVYNARPSYTIHLSEFHVDRVPVTKERYEACRAAGACPDPVRPDNYATADSSDFAPGIDHAGAVAFCTWDGGELVDAFQWEKAVRGPSPDSRLNAWGSGSGDCRHHPDDACPDVPFPIASFPMSVSPWGVRLLGSLKELTDTNALYGYYSAPDLTDPSGPPPDSMGRMTIKGRQWVVPAGTVTRPSAVEWTALQSYWEGFRCVY